MKWNEHERRCAAVSILCNKGDEVSNKEVAEMVGVSRLRVSELCKSLLESMDLRGVVQRVKAAPGNRRKVRTGEFVDKVREIFESTPDQSMRDMAREFGVSDRTGPGSETRTVHPATCQIRA